MRKGLPESTTVGRTSRALFGLSAAPRDFGRRGIGRRWHDADAVAAKKLGAGLDDQAVPGGFRSG
jgi:hypothetical protein